MHSFPGFVTASLLAAAFVLATPAPPAAQSNGSPWTDTYREPAGRLTGLTLRATDQEWRSGDGPEVAGPSEALAMAMAGRPAALADLDGDGVALLRSRLAD